MKAGITEPGTKVYNGIGFSALTVAELPVGSEVEILTAKKQDGKKWISVALADGRSGFMPGETKVFAVGRTLLLQEAYAETSLWKNTERRDARKNIVQGASWFGGGILGIATDFYIVHAAISSRSGEILFPVKPVLVGALLAVIYGGFRLLMGVLGYVRTVSD